MSLFITKRICDLLLKKKLVSEEDLKHASKICGERGGSLSDILIDMRKVSKEDLLTVFSEEMGFPPFRLSRFNISDEVLGLIPKRVCRTYQILPLSRMGKQLTVAMVDPLNIFALDDLRIITSLDVSPVIVTEDEMKDAFLKYFEKSADEEISAIVEDMESAKMEMVEDDADDFSSLDLLRITEDAPVVKLTNMILGKGVKERASDILIEPLERSSRVRYRIDGVLCERYTPPRKFHQAIVSRIKVMSDLDIAERRLPQDGRFRIKIEDRKVDFRVSIVPSSFGEKIALRVLDKEQAMIDLDSLGFRESAKADMREAARRPHGMVLVCGPTGCGKTTTLYSILKYIDDPEKNVVTVEDPVEYELKGINQVSINDEIGLSFSACLRSILRQDPDIIMVGEIRDHETLDVAIKSALTGHLVLSTLHTNTAAGSVVRMVNMGIEPFLITASVELVAAQRLLRKLCTECKEPYMPTRDVAEKYGLFDEKGGIKQIFRPIGCKKCVGTGYQGRVAIAECLKLSPAIKELIFKNAQEHEIERQAKEEGMSTLRQNGIYNVLEGVSSLEDVLRITVMAR
ncbi:MAG: ATPase, T2SS/T4P/T4SS family [Candidatus Omnitrophica bacterium]|nr:ATPase, T2SS/T4P/T4SS family [Candidatus Omnitrophota bacterium]MDD5488376.1 ATPase, T2SS/T4P/T4SS family [Candidatus Omnitrophota bacterium]